MPQEEFRMASSGQSMHWNRTRLTARVAPKMNMYEDDGILRPFSRQPWIARPPTPFGNEYCWGLSLHLAHGGTFPMSRRLAWSSRPLIDSIPHRADWSASVPALLKTFSRTEKDRKRLPGSSSCRESHRENNFDELMELGGVRTAAYDLYGVAGANNTWSLDEIETRQPDSGYTGIAQKSISGNPITF